MSLQNGLRIPRRENTINMDVLWKMEAKKADIYLESLRVSSILVAYNKKK